jgi:hypothetical protein
MLACTSERIMQAWPRSVVPVVSDKLHALGGSLPEVLLCYATMLGGQGV